MESNYQKLCFIYSLSMGIHYSIETNMELKIMSQILTMLTKTAFGEKEFQRLETFLKTDTTETQTLKMKEQESLILYSY